jgi:hypothetical protein
MSPGVHFVTAAEATPYFCRLACLWAWSLRQRAGALSDSPLTVVFNDRTDPDAETWLRRLPGVRVLARPRVSRIHKEANKYSALWAPEIEQADWVILTDCDVVCADRLDPLPNLLAGVEFASVLDGMTPRADGTYRPSVYRYDRLLQDLGSISAETLASHHLTQYDGIRLPGNLPYFNGGMLAIAGRRVPAFREVVVELSNLIHRWSQPGLGQPLRLVQRAWNSMCSTSASGEKLMIGWHVRRKRFADQAAIFPAVLKLGLPYRVLPHAYNWRSATMAAPSESPRLIHYYQHALGIPPARILDPDWIPAYRDSTDPGRRALAGVVADFLEHHPDCPHRP